MCVCVCVCIFPTATYRDIFVQGGWWGKKLLLLSLLLFFFEEYKGRRVNLQISHVSDKEEATTAEFQLLFWILN